MVDIHTSNNPLDPNLVAANIKTGVTIYGILSTMPAVPENTNGTAGQLVITIPEGYSDGSETTTANDANLVAGNIKDGVTIFGVTGKFEGSVSGDISTWTEIEDPHGNSGSQIWISYQIIGNLVLIGRASLHGSTHYDHLIKSDVASRNRIASLLGFSTVDSYAEIVYRHVAGDYIWSYTGTYGGHATRAEIDSGLALTAMICS